MFSGDTLRTIAASSTTHQALGTSSSILKSKQISLEKAFPQLQTLLAAAWQEKGKEIPESEAEEIDRLLLTEEQHEESGMYSAILHPSARYKELLERQGQHSATVCYRQNDISGYHVSASVQILDYSSDVVPSVSKYRRSRRGNKGNKQAPSGKESVFAIPRVCVLRWRALANSQWHTRDDGDHRNEITYDNADEETKPTSGSDEGYFDMKLLDETDPPKHLELGLLPNQVSVPNTPHLENSTSAGPSFSSMNPDAEEVAVVELEPAHSKGYKPGSVTSGGTSSTMGLHKFQSVLLDSSVPEPAIQVLRVGVWSLLGISGLLAIVLGVTNYVTFVSYERTMDRVSLSAQRQFALADLGFHMIELNTYALNILPVSDEVFDITKQTIIQETQALAAAHHELYLDAEGQEVGGPMKRATTCAQTQPTFSLHLQLEMYRDLSVPMWTLKGGIPTKVQMPLYSAIQEYMVSGLLLAEFTR